MFFCFAAIYVYMYIVCSRHHSFWRRWRIRFWEVPWEVLLRHLHTREGDPKKKLAHWVLVSISSVEWLQVGTHQVSLQLRLLWISTCPHGLEEKFLMNIEFTTTNLVNYMWYMPLFSSQFIALTDQLKLTWLGWEEKREWIHLSFSFLFFFWWGSFIRRNIPIAIIQ